MTYIPLSRLLAEGRDPSWPVAESGGERFTFGQFRSDVAFNADRLRAIGCRRGLLIAEDAYWAAVGLFSLLYAGATAVMPRNLQPGRLDSENWDCIVCSQLPQCLKALKRDQFLLLGRAQELRTTMPALDPSTCRLELSTSGSTGTAKSIGKTIEAMEREAETIEAILGGGLPVSALFLATVPSHHLYGLAFRLVWPLSTGRPFLGETHEYWESLAAGNLGGAVLITSPAHLTRLSISALPVFKRPAMVVSAGAPLPAAAADEAKNILGVPITEIFGSTETSTIAWRERIGPEPFWRTLPGVSVARSPDGRMAVRSPFLGEDLVVDGWYSSADLIELDANGGFRLKGRADRVFKIEGKRISLPEIEAQLHDLDLVAEAAVVFLDGTRPHLGAVVVLSAAGKGCIANLGSFRVGQLLRKKLSETLEPAGLPRQWRFVETMPVAALGKRSNAELTSLFSTASEPKAAARVTEPEVRATRPIEDGVELDLFIPSTLAQLEGHFPGLPIVPGVAQIDWVVKLAARHLNLPIEVARSFQIKFRRVTTANIMVTLTLRHRVSRQQIVFEYRAGDTVMTSGTFAFENPL